MNKLNEIFIELANNGWEVLDDELFSNDYKFKADIFYNQKGWYEIRVALLSIFDRWANSGKEIKLYSYDEVIDFFKNKRYMIIAFGEVLDIIEHDLREQSEDRCSAETLMNFITDSAIKWIINE